ncbi:MAG: enoyl-CoA hydratase-related protein [Gammaproteobacteria bacterium]|nr:enoyl-CoA hydratase-related protein [Gammaproteobacteria bacterium]
MSEQILVQREDAVATVILNRPAKLNAMTKDMWRQLGETVESLSGDDGLRCVVLRGAGSKSFSPGNDIGEFEHERANVDQARAYGGIMARTIHALQACRHPTVASIHGICVGGGLEIACCCDLRICGASSRFGVPINKLGLVMALPELEGLVRLVGRSAATEILLEGRVFAAEEALRLGLVNRVVEDDEVENATRALVQRVIDGAPLVARWHKQFIKRLEDPTPLTAEEIDEGYRCFGTEDFRIGYRAFLKKQKPKFVGK